MKRPIVTLSLLLLFCLTARGEAQVRFSGWLQSSAYVWETLDANQQTDFYQGLFFKLRSTDKPNLSFQSYLRVAYRGEPADWDEQLYNSYLKWRSNDHKYQIRIGRQFLYSGVINGTLDGVLVGLKPMNDLHIKLLGGLVAPFERPFKILEWDAGNVFGGYGAYTFSRRAKLDVSYYQRQVDSETIWQLAGGALNGELLHNLYYQAVFDYNLQRSEYQGMRYRLTYYTNDWSFSGEYNSQKPRVFENSFFSIFELGAYNQMRAASTYTLGNYQLGLQYLYTIYEEDENANQIIATAGSNWGMIGLVFQNGFGGDNIGVFGQINYDLFRQLTLKFNSSFYQYERHAIAITEDATAVTGGLEYRPIQPLRIAAEMQQAMNSYFDNDTRGFFRLNYTFDYGK